MVIIFGENNKVENIGILTGEEAQAYVYFLKEERKRHIENIDEATKIIRGAKDPHSILTRIGKKFVNACVELWQSAIKRHEEDIKAIDVLVTTLKGFYGI